MLAGLAFLNTRNINVNIGEIPLSSSDDDADDIRLFGKLAKSQSTAQVCGGKPSGAVTLPRLRETSFGEAIA